MNVATIGVSRSRKEKRVTITNIKPGETMEANKVNVEARRVADEVP
jgi:hypothetical protein